MIDYATVAQEAANLADSATEKAAEAQNATRLTYAPDENPEPLLMAAYYAAQFAVTYARTCKSEALRVGDALETIEKEGRAAAMFKERAEDYERRQARAAEMGDSEGARGYTWHISLARRNQAASELEQTKAIEFAETKKELAQWHYTTAIQAIGTAYSMLYLFRDGAPAVAPASKAPRAPTPAGDTRYVYIMDKIGDVATMPQKIMSRGEHLGISLVERVGGTIPGTGYYRITVPDNGEIQSEEDEERDTQQFIDLVAECRTFPGRAMPVRYAIEISLIAVDGHGSAVRTLDTQTTHLVSSDLKGMTSGLEYMRETLGNVIYDHQRGETLTDRYTGAPYYGGEVAD